MGTQGSLDFTREASEMPMQRVASPSGPLDGGTGARDCEFCEKSFYPKSKPASKQRFCSTSCRFAAWQKDEDTANAEKERLMALAAERGKKEMAIARRAAVLCAGALRTPIIISHVREYLRDQGVEIDWSAAWTGSLFHHSKWCEATGRRTKAFHKEANARKVQEYRLSSDGWIAFHSFRNNRNNP